MTVTVCNEFRLHPDVPTLQFEVTVIRFCLWREVGVGTVRTSQYHALQIYDLRRKIMPIRRAKMEEAATLTEIAFAAKRHWNYPERWIELWSEDLTITSEFIERHEVFMAVEQGKPIGFYALATSEGKTELDHLWVLPEWIGKGIGRQLLAHALDRAAALNVATIEIVSDPNAEAFYLKAGARKIGEVISSIEGQQRRLPRLAIEILRTGDIPK